MPVLAVSLLDLVKDNHSLTNLRSTNTKLLEIKWKKDNPLLFSFLAKSNETYSDPLGHIVVIQFFKDAKNTPMLTKDCRVACTCPAYLYWGSKYNATQGDYFYKSQIDIAPDIRDPKRERKICKHIVAVRQVMRNLNDKSVHKKYKDTFDYNPKVDTVVRKQSKVKSSAIQTIDFNEVEVIASLQRAIPSIDPLATITDDSLFETYLETLLGMYVESNRGSKCQY